jgi:hypothetical protein
MSLGNLKLHGHSDHFFLGVNQSDHGMSSTSNYRFYKALKRLHGPWCKQPLKGIVQGQRHLNRQMLKFLFKKGSYYKNLDGWGNGLRKQGYPGRESKDRASNSEGTRWVGCPHSHTPHQPLIKQLND